ncbi:hypothetical protein ABIB15_002387 [Marisediminicola sp. UYEF4]|uniref:hypothetical protein n=1 Tax=Marisediminicola sp. UYEF4 TaxID=1756384 RepID=UPI00339556AC
MSTAPHTTRRNRPVRIALSALAVGAAAVIHLFAQAGMLFFRPEWSISTFRAYYPFDQLSYLSMVTNASMGDYAAVEPFTETGSNFYPRAWYLFLGTVARVLDLYPPTAWQVGGLVIQVMLVVTLAVTLIIMTGRPLTGLLAPAPFVLGTFAFLGGENWFTSMGSHAVLWGPFGVLHTLNGEAASLSIAGMAILLLLLAWGRDTPRARRIVLTLVAAAAIGALANVQTYSFLAAVYIASMVAAAWALVRWRNRVAIVLSIVLLPTLFIVGPIVFERFGQLPSLVFGLLPAIPGLVLLLVRAGPLVLAYFGIAVLAAAPQVVFTVLGIASDDPFLSYRVASNQNLGVEPGPGLLGAVVLLLPLAALAAAGVIRRRPLWIAYPIGAATTWFILATNDIWGPNAEPYRLWIDSFLLVAVGLLPLFVTAVIDLAGPGARTPDRAGAARSLRVGTVVVAALVTLTAAVSATDWIRFYQDDEVHGVFVFTDSRSAAHSDLARLADDGSGDLVGMDTCVDPQIVKLNSGAPVAFYNLGMAWPQERDAVQSFLADRAEGEVDLDTLAAAGIGWMLTDSACGDGWEQQFDGELDVADRAAYDGGEATLWRLPAP